MSVVVSRARLAEALPGLQTADLLNTHGLRVEEWPLPDGWLGFYVADTVYVHSGISPQDRQFAVLVGAACRQCDIRAHRIS